MPHAPVPLPNASDSLVTSQTVQEVLEALAREQPRSAAIHVAGRTTLTYEDLGSQIRHVRERLQGWGIQAGDVVGGALLSRPELTVAIATMPASCTFAPLDPSLPADAYAVLLARMHVRAILATQGQEHPIRIAARRLSIAEIDLCPSDDAAGMFTLELCRTTSSLCSGTAGDPGRAYILTTSGTTGQRKLVPGDHRVELGYSRAIRDWFGFTSDDIGVHLMPATSAHGVRSSLVNPLLAGSSIVLLDEADVDGFFVAIEQFQPTFLTCSFSLLRDLLRRAPERRAVLAHHRLRFMRSGSGHLDLEVAERLEDLFAVPVLTGLSSTETCRIAAEPLPPRARKRGSVGLPMVNEVALLDAAGNIRHEGGPGEIIVRGPLVFRGYVDDPALTAASFLGDWFRTGDVGHIDEDGYIRVAGRLKEIINRGGEKISPVEIDIAIQSSPGVKEAAAFAVPHPTLGEEMVAAVVREPLADVDEASIIEHVRVRVGTRRVPRRVYFVPLLPRDASGKLRRGALPEMLGLAVQSGPRRSTPTETAARLSPLESALAGLWSSLLAVEHAGRDDDFFLLGGDSLLGMQLIAQVRSLFGVDLPLQSLFGEAATLAGLARAIEVRRSERLEASRAAPQDDVRANAAIPHRAGAGVALSYAQLRMWLLAQFNPGGRAYHVTAAYRLSGTIDVAALQQALLDVIERHEALRTTYVLVDDEPRQMIHEQPAMDFKSIDLERTPASERHRVVMSLIDADEQVPFDLEAGPLLRFRLIRLMPDEHVLTRIWHHIVTDGWSGAIFDRELSIAYNARLRGETPALPRLEVRYADYALWQRGWLRGVEGERQLKYWREELKGLQTLDVATDHPRPPAQSEAGARLERILPSELLAGMAALARAEGATLFMVVTAAFVVLLHRYTDAEDIAVGMPIGGRRRAEFAGVIGFFLNTVVLRPNLAGNPSFSEVLARVRARALAAYDNQDLPFEKVVEELASSRDPSRNPLFQVCCAMQLAEPTLSLDGVQASAAEPPRLSAKFDLTLLMRELPQGMQLTLEYCTAIFEGSTIERMADHLVTLLQGIVADPDVCIAELPLLGDAERRKLLLEWNHTQADVSGRSCVHELVEAQAARSPGALAVSSGHESVTYAELNAHANQLAQRLVALGAGPASRIAVCVQRSVELIVAWLAVLKTGAAYVPLDASQPPARLATILGDVQAVVLLSTADIAGRLPLHAARVVHIDSDAAALPQGNLARRAAPDDTAYICYTSGSTGQPKGVAITHRALANLVSWHCDAYAVVAADRATQLCTPAFDAAGWEIWPYLCAGASVHLVDDHVRTDAVALVQWLARAEITLAFMPTPLAEMALRERWPPACALRALLTGGDRLNLRPPLDLPFRVVNHYGPTENTVVSTCAQISARGDGRRSPPIGRPLPNTRAYVLDARLQPVPIGVPGELVLGGVQVARGYWNEPELTRQRFVPDPFSTTPGARMYRTGDRARFRQDGNLEFLGRLDDQLKVRGFRVEPAEIEAALATHPGVRELAVVARDEGAEASRLVAHVVPADRGTCTVEALRTLARERLPDYMRPAEYVLMEELPLTPHGKVDRRALATSPLAERFGPGERHVAPRNALEASLAAMWRAVLKRDTIGMHDDFFALGGHSLLAAQVIARITEELGVRLPLRQLFEAPTISDLARCIRGTSAPPEQGELARILADVEALTEAQAALQLGPEPLGRVDSSGQVGAKAAR